MIVLMPEDRKGLAVLDDFLYKTSFFERNNNYHNILDQIAQNMEFARKKGRESIDVEIPIFSISSDIPAMDYLQKVSYMMSDNIWPYFSMHMISF